MSMSGAALYYPRVPGTPATTEEALAAVAAAARRIAGMTPADAGCVTLLARLSVQLCEATTALENATAREMIIAKIRGDAQAPQPGRRLRAVPREPGRRSPRRSPERLRAGSARRPPGRRPIRAPRPPRGGRSGPGA